MEILTVKVKLKSLLTREGHANPTIGHENLTVC
jgi:hypothetical protein